MEQNQLIKRLKKSCFKKIIFFATHYRLANFSSTHIRIWLYYLLPNWQKRLGKIQRENFRALTEFDKRHIVRRIEHRERLERLVYTI